MLTAFPGQQKGEKVLMVIRKHPVVYLRILFVFCLVTVFPLLIFLRVWSKNFSLSQSGYLGLLGYLGASLYFIYSIALLLISWLNEEFDIFILTDRRLIDITQVSLFKRTIATTPLDQIQDTTSHVNGVIGTLLNYGTIDVQTAAGNASDFAIDHIHQPDLVARKILTQVEEKKNKDRGNFNVS